jgi:hypothetical protein
VFLDFRVEEISQKDEENTIEERKRGLGQEKSLFKKIFILFICASNLRVISPPFPSPHHTPTPFLPPLLPPRYGAETIGPYL